MVPPTKTASLSRRGARSGARDRTIRRVKARGRRRGKKASGSHQHARVENAFFRYTSIVGEAGIVTPDTILRWYRRLIARRTDGRCPAPALTRGRVARGGGTKRGGGPLIASGGPPSRGGGLPRACAGHWCHPWRCGRLCGACGWRIANQPRNPLRLSSLVILGVVARMSRCATRSSYWFT